MRPAPASAELRAPVALFVFNRPDQTRRVFAEIRRARPRRLFVVADGPRAGRPGEAASCAAVRAVVEAVDWPCDVQRDYAAANLGCRLRVSSGLNWVFAACEEAIILEDDCLPHSDFFRFCDELLERYRPDDRVMHIGGANFQFGRRHGSASYYFSRYAHVWGWASWRRAWRHYDVSLRAWPLEGERVVRQFERLGERWFWRWTWSEVRAGRIDTWDYQWGFACAARGGLAIVPNANLVSNLGFGATATHTRDHSRWAGLPLAPVGASLHHPLSVERSVAADDRTRALFFARPPLAGIAPTAWRRAAGLVGQLSGR
jgi:hypothetical protein